MIEINDLSAGQFYVNTNIRFITNVLWPRFSYYSNVYTVAKRTIDLLAAIADENDQA